MPAFLVAGPFSARDGEGRSLFEDVTLELQEGQLTVLDGPSGSGKSTLLRQLVGLVPTAGAARELAGASYSGPQLPLWRSRVTLVAQDAPMLAGTVADNLRFPFGQSCAGGRKPDDSRLSELLVRTGLAAIPEERAVGTLSGGERHRLALVRGLLWEPAVLVADEPFSGIDEKTAVDCFDLLAEYAGRRERAVLVVLHERSLAQRADRVVTLRQVEGRPEA